MRVESTFSLKLSSFTLWSLELSVSVDAASLLNDQLSRLTLGLAILGDCTAHIGAAVLWQCVLEAQAGHSHLEFSVDARTCRMIRL